MWHSVIALGVIKTPKEITVNGVKHPRLRYFDKWSKDELAKLLVLHQLE